MDDVADPAPDEPFDKLRAAASVQESLEEMRRMADRLVPALLWSVRQDGFKDWSREQAIASMNIKSVFTKVSESIDLLHRCAEAFKS